MARLRFINNTAIVFLFAICHFGVAVVSRMLHYYDDIPLTILTILMVIVVAMNNRTRVDIMAILTMVATLLGFVIGSWLRAPMQSLLQSDTFAPAVTTFVITAVLGVSIDVITIRVKRLRSNDTNFTISPKHIVAIGLSILILRMGYVVMDRAGIFTENMILDNILNIVVNSWAVLLLLAGNIILTIQISKQKKSDYRNSYTATLSVILSSLIIFSCYKLLFWSSLHCSLQLCFSLCFLQLRSWLQCSSSLCGPSWALSPC